ncbi:MAG: hypothetical protein A2V99_00850 [Spirochaetes bacterium RBG_16_67_19]|nr:MAG: hypothetical protein A2V99_00850 [Spirochaetes bacterium RBG_16_67_19]
MSLLPIDLQTMFSQMSQIGKEQAVAKEVPPQLQAMQAEQIVRKSEHDDKAVNQAREPGEGPEKVREEGRRGKRRRGSPRERRPPGQEPAEGGEQERREVFEDPALGHNVDLVG